MARHKYIDKRHRELCEKRLEVFNWFEQTVVCNLCRQTILSPISPTAHVSSTTILLRRLGAFDVLTFSPSVDGLEDRAPREK
jgi:hypothetical protein